MKLTPRTSLLALLPALVAAVLLSACNGQTLHGGRLEPAKAAASIELTDYRGQPFSMAQQRNKVVLVFFGYTSCPDVCPTTLAHMAQVKRQLGDAFEDVRVVFITVDPNRDTPDKLARYMTLFDSDFLGLTGSPTELRRVMNAYQVTAVRRESAETAQYSIDHSAFTYVIDKQGRLRELMTFGAPVAELVSDVHLLLQE